MLPRVVWAEESKNGLRFEIGPNYYDVPTTSQFLSDRQSSCTQQISNNIKALGQKSRLELIDLLTKTAK